MLKLFAKYLSFILVIILAYYFLDLNATWLTIKNIPILDGLITILLIVFCFIVAGLRWAFICKGVGIPDVNIVRKIKLNYAASFVDMVFPIYGGSDAFCVFVITSTRKGMGWRAISSVLASRVNGYIIAILFTLGTSFFIELPPLWTKFIPVILFLFFVSLFFLPKFINILSDRFEVIKVIPFHSLAFKKAWASSMVLSIASQVILITSRAWIGWSLGMDLTWIEFAFISSILIILTPLVPSFGFIGLGTATFVSFAAMIGASPEAAAALSVVWYGCWIIATLPGLVFFNQVDGKLILRKIKSQAGNIFNGRLKNKASIDV